MGVGYETDSSGNQYYKIIPDAKGTKFNEAVTLNTDIFGAFITPTTTPAVLRIYVCFLLGGTLKVQRKIGGTTVTELLNAGAALVANASYSFDIIVDATESINLQYSVSTTALKVSVVEV
jgi:hypothetical protein